MANIALNKPSGGQLILSPEDGTSTETVTIPSGGLGGKFLSSHWVEGTRNRYAVSTSSWSEPDSSLRVTVTPTSANSKFIVLLQVSINISSALITAIPVVTVNGTTTSLVGETDSTGGVDKADVLSSIDTLSEMFRAGWGTFPVHAVYEATSTDELVFKMYAKTNGAGHFFGDNSARNSLIVLEVAA